MAAPQKSADRLLRWRGLEPRHVLGIVAKLAISNKVVENVTQAVDLEAGNKASI